MTQDRDLPCDNQTEQWLLSSLGPLWTQEPRTKGSGVWRFQGKYGRRTDPGIRRPGFTKLVIYPDGWVVSVVECAGGCVRVGCHCRRRRNRVRDIDEDTIVLKGRWLYWSTSLDFLNHRDPRSEYSPSLRVLPCIVQPLFALYQKLAPGIDGTAPHLLTDSQAIDHTYITLKAPPSPPHLRHVVHELPPESTSISSPAYPFSLGSTAPTTTLTLSEPQSAPTGRTPTIPLVLRQRVHLDLRPRFHLQLVPSHTR